MEKELVPEGDWEIVEKVGAEAAEREETKGPEEEGTEDKLECWQ